MFTHPYELELLRYLHQYRNEAFDVFFKFLDYFDQQYFYFMLIPLVWFLINWRAGVIFSYIILSNGLINLYFKFFFELPRPQHLDPSLGLLKFKFFGFPSGGAQNAVVLAGLALYYWKNRWKWLLAPIYVLLISFSRIYLGAHFFTDILGGWIIGIIFIAIVLTILPSLERFLKKYSANQLFLISLFLPCTLLFLFPYTPVANYSGILIGINLGLYLKALSHHLPTIHIKNKIDFSNVLQTLIYAIAMFMIVQNLPKNPNNLAFSFFVFFILGITMSFLSK